MRTKKKNTMRTPEEKEQIVLEYLQDKNPSGRKTAAKYDISYSSFCYWLRYYRKSGIDGLKSQTGKTKCSRKGNPYGGLQKKKAKTREEELELENLRLKIEVARLKKGYQVKGVGSKKEYVTIKDLNTKS
jgi:transposase-like protein